jgi:hypothetical protein
MSEFNKKEKAIATLLSNFPTLKQKIKYIYKTINTIVFKKSYKFKTNLKLEKIEFKNYETFFGYYDKYPENQSGTKLIFQASKYPTKRKPNSNNSIFVVLQNLKTKETTTFETTAYNWQQGAKLQWINNNYFIFNDFDKKNNEFISKIINAQTKKVEKIINYPIYDIFENTALSLNFSKLSQFSPDYGYRNKTYQTNTKEIAIYSINIKSNQKQDIISFEQIINIEKSSKFQNAKHTVNHIMISPKGDKFIFIHRYYIAGKRFDRLMIAEINGKNLKCINNSGMISHCNWINNDKIFGYMKFEQENGFFEINLITNKIQKILENKIDKFGDGHPTISKNKIIFDTYPDRSGMQHLFYLNTLNNDFKELGEFFHSTTYFGENRCDLHPRITKNNNKIYFDSVFSGKRQLYNIFLEEN